MTIDGSLSSIADHTVASNRMYRLSIAGRVVLAVIGGYAAASFSLAGLSLCLSLPRSKAVVAATLASFSVMALEVCWVFAARSLRAVALGLGLPLALLSGVLWVTVRVGWLSRVGLNMGAPREASRVT